MEENKNTVSLGDGDNTALENQEKEPDKAKNTSSELKVNMFVDERERQKKIDEEKHNALMATDLSYRRNYYQQILYTAYNMMPQENYYKEEYNEITERYNKAFDKIDTLTEEADMQKIIDDFRDGTKKILTDKKAFNIIFGCLILAIVAFLAFCIIKVKMS